MSNTATNQPLVNINLQPGTPHPYQQVVNILASAFDHFNSVLLNGELKETPIIAVMPRGRRAAYGWFVDEKWEDKGIRRPEINISAETLNRPIANVLGTLVHEMAHMLNAQNGISDCNAAQYHNKHFKTAAEKLGMIVTRMPGKGFAVTTVGPTLQAAIDTFCQMENTSVFVDFARTESNGRGITKQVFSIPAHETDKLWFDAESASSGMSKKDLLSQIISAYEASRQVKVKSSKSVISLI